MARPITSILSLHVGQGKVRDTYLTPLLYTGTSLGIEAQRWRLHSNLRWASWQQADLAYALASDHGDDSDAQAGRLRYRYGALRSFASPYSFPDEEGRAVADRRGAWTFYVGPYIGIDVGFNYNTMMASGNNPATARLSADVGAAAAVAYRFQNPRAHGLSVMLQAHGPLAGFGFMPEYGASYYETFYLGHSDGSFHFTSLHNQQDLDLQLSADVPLALIPWLRRCDTVLRLGGAYRIETMDVNHLVTRFSSFDFVIGWVIQTLPYSRRKSSLLNRPAYEAY